MKAYLPIKELQRAICSRVQELYLAEIDVRIQSLEQQKTNTNIDNMIMFLGLQHKKNGMSKEQRAEINRANGKLGGAPKGNKNALKKE